MKSQRGFGAIAAIVILVILAVMGATIVSISTSQQITSAQDIQSTRAWQAARAGNEWGLFKALNSTIPADTWKTCSNLTQTIDLTADTGFHVTVTCDSWSYNEGQYDNGGVMTVQGIRVFRITSVACTAAVCPATDVSAAGLGYIERTRTVLATDR